MAARTGDGEQVEQREVVEAQHLDQPRGGTLALVEIEPAVELLLCQPRRSVDAADTVCDQRRIVALGRKGDLVAQIGQAIIHRSGREHKHPRPDPLADNFAHQPVVARLATGLRRLLIAEVVRLVDDDKIIVAPVHMGKIDIAGKTAVTRQIGMVQDIIVEAIRRQDVAAVVRLIERPVIA